MSMFDSSRLDPMVWGKLLPTLPLSDLFDRLSDTVFFIKDSGGRYLLVNDTLAKRCKHSSKDELIGKLPSTVLGKALGERYEAQDKLIIETGTPILDRLEVHIYPDRTTGWCITNKFPLIEEDGSIVGLAGISKDLGAPHIDNDNFPKLKSVIEHVKEHISETHTIQDLSEMAGLSPYQLDRRMQQIFGLTTGQWVLKQRIDFARQELTESDKPLAEIAMDAGYEDQSAFSRQFKKATGLTPTQVRKILR
ncbi:AraC family transcriptional regulator [Hyphomonas sp. FCG-A18]|uniref:AraC family transcriptional regulator n=1 Tax=Hyphomonas sp. FCG-A18 TaxID=3080019 RepID=UPI002B2F5D08|nr:AraC family transcriptional regulator [Hyphomonas sp. FCG-A18]